LTTSGFCGTINPSRVSSNLLSKAGRIRIAHY
jgi:hypothetical protein